MQFRIIKFQYKICIFISIIFILYFNSFFVVVFQIYFSTAWPFSEEDDGRWNVDVPDYNESKEPEFFPYEGESVEEFRNAWLME